VGGGGGGGAWQKEMKWKLFYEAKIFQMSW